MLHALTKKTISPLPQELLVLASSHEQQEMHRHRLLALRFLPFSVGLSRLMKMLALESEQRLDELARAAERLGAGALPALAAVRDGRTRDGHFFIINEQVASQALSQAVIDEHQSLRFYRELLEANATPELHRLLSACVRQKQAQGYVLQESQDQLLAADSVSYRCSA